MDPHIFLTIYDDPDEVVCLSHVVLTVEKAEQLCAEMGKLICKIKQAEDGAYVLREL